MVKNKSPVDSLNNFTLSRAERDTEPYSVLTGEENRCRSDPVAVVFICSKCGIITQHIQMPPVAFGNINADQIADFMQKFRYHGKTVFVKSFYALIFERYAVVIWWAYKSPVCTVTVKNNPKT